MPTYDVNNRGAQGLWLLPNGPPGPAHNRPRAVMQVGNAQEVDMGQQSQVALSALVTGLYTNHLTDCSAFCVLWRPAGGAWQRAGLIHMMGGPDPNAVNWATLTAGMVGGQSYGILANSRATVLSANFMATAQANTNIPAGNLWIYNADAGAINFGLNWNGIAGEV